MPHRPERVSRNALQRMDAEAKSPSIAGMVRAALRTPDAPAESRREGLPLPASVPAYFPSDARYTVTVIDASGRLASRSPLTTLGWLAHTPLSITIAHGAIVVEVDDDSSTTVSDQRYLHLPATIRHQIHLRAGDRVLAAAQVNSGLLLLYPEAVIDGVLLGYHRSQILREES